MTDEELVKALRDFADDGYADLSVAAADRIEALTAELAKAVEALREIYGNGNAAGRNPQLMANIARATLAEIEGEKG